MNDQDRMRRRNDIARLFRHTSKIHRNCVRINTGNSPAHEMTKFYVCWGLVSLGHEYITEAEFENGAGRADIVDLDDGVAIEVIKSEKQESIDMKKSKYPLPIIVVPVGAEQKGL